MRKIKYIMVHCTASRQSTTASAIVDYHLRPVSMGGRGWQAPGYHYIIEADGRVVSTWPEEKISNGVKGYNSISINVAYIGGVDASKRSLPPVDNRTQQQKVSLLSLLRELKRKYPEAQIRGHRDFAPKDCPSFDATKEYSFL